MADIVTADLPQLKVNKCLIALVGKKAVAKTTEGVSSLSTLQLLSLRSQLTLVFALC